MKKETAIFPNMGTANETAPTVNRTARHARQAVDSISRYYSQVLGKQLSTRQTLTLINAQAAFFMTVFPADCTLTVRGICAAWLVSALIKCRNSGIRTSD